MSVEFKEQPSTAKPPVQEAITTANGTEASKAAQASEVISAPIADIKPKQEDSVSSKFAALAKKERAMLQKVQSRQAEIEAREKALAEKEAKYAGYDQKPGNPIEALERLGYSYKDITDYILNDNKPTVDQEVKSVREELQSFKQAQEEAKKTAIEAQAKQEQEELDKAIAGFKGEISDYLTTNNVEAELINLYGAQEVVYETMDEYYNLNGKVLSIAEGVKMVEDYLYEQTQKAQGTSKFKPKAADPKEEPKFQAKQQSKTLTNEHVSTVATVLPSKTEQDRIKRALLALEKTN